MGQESQYKGFSWQRFKIPLLFAPSLRIFYLHNGKICINVLEPSKTKTETKAMYQRTCLIKRLLYGLNE